MSSVDSHPLPPSSADSDWFPYVSAVLKLAANSLGDAPDPQTQRQVARLFESVGYILPANAKEQYLEALKKSPMYPHLRSKSQCSTWIQEVLSSLDTETQQTTSMASSSPSLKTEATQPIFPMSALPNLTSTQTFAPQPNNPTPAFFQQRQAQAFQPSSRAPDFWEKMKSNSSSIPSIPPIPSATTPVFEPSFDGGAAQFHMHAQTRFVPSSGLGTAGTPAGYRLGFNRAHSRALDRLQQSAQNFRSSSRA